MHLTLSPYLVPGNHTQRASQAGLLPRVPSHPHAQSEHRGQGAGLGAAELPGGEVSGRPTRVGFFFPAVGRSGGIFRGPAGHSLAYLRVVLMEHLYWPFARKHMFKNGEAPLF